jgi:hypothetical protein
MSTSFFYSSTLYLLIIPITLIRVTEVTHHIIHLILTCLIGSVKRVHLRKHWGNFRPLTTGFMSIPGTVYKSWLTNGKSLAFCKTKKKLFHSDNKYMYMYKPSQGSGISFLRLQSFLKQKTIFCYFCKTDISLLFNRS